MDLGELQLFSAIKQRLKWLSARQGQIAENVANANAPGYTPMTLKEQDFSDLVAATQGADKRLQAAVAMRRTQNQHFDINGSGGDRAPQARRVNEVFERLPNGNAVVLEQEMVDQAKTQLEYNMLLSIYRKHGSMLRTAVARPNGG